MSWNINGCTYSVSKEPGNVFCECGKPIELYESRYQLPIYWEKCTHTKKSCAKEVRKFIDDVSHLKSEE